MSGLNKSSKCLILSSDSETSDNGKQKKKRQRVTKKQKLAYSSKQIRKGASLSNEYQLVENHQPDAVSNTSSEPNGNNVSNIISADLNELNNKSSEILNTVNENSIITIDDNNEESNANQQESNTNQEEQSNVNQEESTANQEESNLNYEQTINITNNSNTPLIQTYINEYFIPPENGFQNISSLIQNTFNFRIRCKIIRKSPIRFFGTSSKVFDGIVCDTSGEIKVVGFNEQVDRFYNIMLINETVVIENGNIQMANENFRSPYSPFEIRLSSFSSVESYSSNSFKPRMIITKKDLRDVSQTLHGSRVDVEGVIIMDRGLFTTTSESTGENFRRRTAKIKDNTSAINITFWNRKIDELPEEIINKNIRIRNGTTNHYNDYVSINVSDQSIIEIY